MSETSHEEGLDLGIAKNLWVKIAASECRIRLLTELISLKIGLKDVEDYNVGLELKFRSDAFKNRDHGDKKVVQQVMNVKLRDEVELNREMNREKILWRRKIGEYTSNKRQYLRVIKDLRLEAQKIKIKNSITYRKKLES